MLILKIALAAALIVFVPPVTAAVFLVGLGALRRLVKGTVSGGQPASRSAQSPNRLM
jgi:hypothetical protein